MKSNFLSISWLDGQMKAVALQRGEIQGSFEQTGLASDFSDFSTVLSSALSKTGALSNEVVMVLAHSRLGQQIVETPPAKGRKLEQYLERRVQQTKAFEGEASWSAQTAFSAQGTNASLLHLLPKMFVNQLVNESRRTGMELVKLLPATAVLASQLKDLSLAPDELALLVADTGSTTTVVIGQKSGRVCMARVLRGNWNLQMETLAVELTRTIGFAEQETGQTVGSAWLFGRNAPVQLSAVQALLRVPVKLSPVECTPFYWAEQAARMLDKDGGNLISAELREAPRRRQRLTVTSILLLVFLLAALATTGFCELRRRSELAAIDRQNVELGKLQEQKVDWQRKLDELHEKKELVRLVSDEKFPPVPAWFLSYLGETLPDNVALTDFRVARTTNDQWSIEFGGAVQRQGKGPQLVAFRKTFSSLTNKLATGPFHLHIATARPDEAKERFSIAGVTP